MVGFLFYRENHPPLVLGFRFSPYRIEPPGLVRNPTGILKKIYIYIFAVFCLIPCCPVSSCLMPCPKCCPYHRNINIFLVLFILLIVFFFDTCFFLIPCSTNLYLSVCLSMVLPTYLSIYRSIYLSIYLSINK